MSAKGAPTPATVWFGMLGVALGVGLLYLGTQVVLAIACWGLFFLLALVAWPIWAYQREYSLFHRRAILEAVTSPLSRIRAWFWAGHLVAVLQVPVALIAALLLLSLGGLLRTEYWLVLAVDALVLALIAAPLARKLAHEVQAAKAAMATRRWPLLLGNTFLLGVAFLALDYFVVGAPDTRGMPWRAVGEQAFTAVSGDAACPLAGWLGGGLNAVQRLAWHASQLIIPNLPGAIPKLAAWAVFLLGAGTLAYLFTHFLLGVMLLLDAMRGGGTLAGASTLSKAFVSTILVLAVPYIVATLMLADFDPSTLASGANRALAWSDPCRPDPGARNALANALAGDVESARVQAREAAARRIDAEVDALFAGAEKGVDRYLDWYFSVLGEYQRLAAVLVGGFGELMAGQLERHLFADSGFGDALERLDREIAQASLARMSQLADGLDRRAQDVLRSDSCALAGVGLEALGDLKRDRLRASAAVAGGAATGVITAKLLAKKTVSSAVGKVAAKKSLQFAAALAGKVAAKKGGSILLAAAGAAAICAPGGPLAVVCGVVAGGATWLAVDKAMVEIDEARFRAEMRAEIVGALRGQSGDLAAVMKGRHGAVIDNMASAVNERIERAFVPARDGR